MAFQDRVSRCSQDGLELPLQAQEQPDTHGNLPDLASYVLGVQEKAVAHTCANSLEGSMAWEQSVHWEKHKLGLGTSSVGECSPHAYKALGLIPSTS